MNNFNRYYNYLIESGIANDQTLEVITSINGSNTDTLDDILYCLTGYRDIMQYLEAEDYTTYLQYNNDEE
jgi:hypothetical protein